MMQQSAVPRRTALGTLAAGLGSVALAGCAPEGPGAGGAAVEASAAAPRRLFIAGDSTAAEKPEFLHPMAGWGMALPFYTTPRLAIENCAQNGRSSKSFIAEGHLEGIAEDLGGEDVLVIQFGHNDEIIGDARRSTEPWSSFQEKLRRHVDVARTAGAEPVLATPTERRRLDDGELIETHGEYPEAVRALAEEEGVALLDLQRRTLQRWRDLGPAESRRCFHSQDGHQDDTHFSVRGAGAVARMVARGLVDLGVLGSAAFHRLDRTPDEQDMSWDLEDL